jgi:preprotein translocase subunit SecA
MLNWILNKVIGSQNARLVKQLVPVVAQVNAHEPAMQALDDAGLRRKSDELKKRLHERIEELGGGLTREGKVPLTQPSPQGGEGEGEGLDEDALKAERKRRLKNEEKALAEILPEAFALVREASRRVTSMRHFDVQLIGGMVLHQGKIAEMATGEGKTLVATAPAYLNALLGRGVHIVTVNDYLARRDRNWMGPIYESLGLTVGVIQHGLNPAERRQAYGCDLTYGTNNEFGFDYLRDNMAISVEECVQRVLSYAIVDEVDSILIDEARTPLIISGPAEESTDLYYRIDRIIPQLAKETDYTVDEKAHSAMLSEEGIKKAEGLLQVENLYEGGNVQLVHHINQALRAHTLYRRDVEYMIKEGQVVIVDEFTGRLMPGRRWSDGLHQAVEAKEGVKIERENQTLATITFQNYFRMFDKLAGMTGTASTEASEFHEIYKLEVVTIPTNRPLIRTNHQDVVYRTVAEKYLDVVQEIAEMHAAGRPVLVGTISIEKSERLSQLLKQPGPLMEWLQKQRRQLLEELGKGKTRLPDEIQGELERLLKGTGVLRHEDLQALAERLKTADPKSEALYPLERMARTALAAEKVREGIPHHVLNARYHELEAQIVAQAGRFGGVTIATNMAGRGTDILLGGNPEFLAAAEIKRVQEQGLSPHSASSGPAPGNVPDFPEEEKGKILARMREQVQAEHDKVVAVEGLHVLGTERHESRRIDNQLRGRSGRQGDPGSSRFYVSLEDDLMRIFGENRLIEMVKAQILEGEVIGMRMMTRAIESAQKRVEMHNFEIRKQLLRYDDVMNRQREVIYKERRGVLEGQNLKEKILEMAEESVDGLLALYAPEQQEREEWNFKELCDAFQAQFGVLVPIEAKDLGREELGDRLKEIAGQAYEQREGEFGPQQTRRLEHWVMLQVIDSKWKDHLYAMDHLREGIGYRVYGQQDPLVEYQHEAYQMFTQMVAAVRAEVVELIFRIQAVKPEQPARRILAPTEFSHPEAQRVTERPEDQGTERQRDRETERPGSPRVFQSLGLSVSQSGSHSKVGRNDPCPCGSNKKFKRCHGA